MCRTLLQSGVKARLPTAVPSNARFAALVGGGLIPEGLGWGRPADAEAALPGLDPAVLKMVIAAVAAETKDMLLRVRMSVTPPKCTLLAVGVDVDGPPKCQMLPPGSTARRCY
jgi:hypothetical protein